MRVASQPPEPPVCYFGVPIGSEPGYLHPAVIVQTDVLNNSRFNSTMVIVVMSNLRLDDYKGNVLMPKE